MTTHARFAAAIAAVLLTEATIAEAAGLYFSERGVRPMGRAGAFVAGADDLGALWYNPAGLADAGGTLLVDAGWLNFRNTYTRELRVMTPEGAVLTTSSPTVEGASPLLPIPTIAGALALDTAKRWTLAAGGFGPYVALASYRDLPNGEPSPARYTLGSFSGSALAVTGAWLAYKPTPAWRFGAGALALAGFFQSTLTFTTSLQDRLLGAPEQPDFDANAQLRVGPTFAPALSAGLLHEPAPWVRVGVSGQTPMTVDSSATIRVRLPSSPLFRNATIDGDRAQVTFRLPPIVRAGVELRPSRALRVELAFVRELWSVHDEILTVPRGIRVAGIDGTPGALFLPEIRIPRRFRDTSSIRLGGELDASFGALPAQLRAGVLWEESAVPPEYLSLSSLDFEKLVATVGASVRLDDRWRLDLCVTKSFQLPVHVDPARARIPRINPITGNAPLEPINGGSYAASAELFGLGLVYAH